MYGGLTDMPQLRSYEQALKHYESIKPIRGSNNLRPICATTNGRRKKHMQIIKRDDAIACRLYDTDVLTFYKDGVVEYYSGGYISNSTHAFASSIFNHVHFCTKQSVTEVTIGYRKTYHVDPNQTFKMKREGDIWVAIDPPKNFEYYLKRKEYNAHRKPLKEFEAHCIRMAKLCDPKEKQSDRYSVWEGLSNSPNERGWFQRERYKELTNKDTESWGQLVPLILENARTRDVKWVEGEYVRNNYFDTQKIKEFINDMVKYAFADELFEEKEVSKRTFNGNEKFVWDKYEGGRK
tara:strand:+ start:2313 stop:3191 length:879 start_codon:yes stop_codon:yes gene_type:complete